MAGRAGIPVQKQTLLFYEQTWLTQAFQTICGGFLEVSEFDFSLF